jgi:branched-chain amino acid transport system permease protein
LRFVDPESALGVFSMVDYLLMVIIGGLGTLYGSIIGATFFMATQAWLPDLLKSIAALFPDYEIIHRIAERWVAFLGLMFIVAIMVFPKGVVGTAREIIARRKVFDGD